MDSLPRSSETAEQRRISERTRSQRRRNVETNEQTAERLLVQRDYAHHQRSCENQTFLIDINIQKVDTFHRRNLTAHVGRAVLARIEPERLTAFKVKRSKLS